MAKTFEELLEESKKTKEEKLAEKIDWGMVPFIIRWAEHRMRLLCNTKRRFENQTALYTHMVDELNKWYQSTKFFKTDKFRMNAELQDSHGRIKMVFTYVCEPIERVCNFGSLINEFNLSQLTGGNYYI